MISKDLEVALVHKVHLQGGYNLYVYFVDKWHPYILLISIWNHFYTTCSVLSWQEMTIVCKMFQSTCILQL